MNVLLNYGTKVTASSMSAVEGAKYFGANKREGLNAEVQSPTFEEFNKRTTVDAPYVWENRMYLNPVFYNEVYKNPQMVQAPGY